MSETQSMQGKVCLVTGATHGLGLAAATALARMGAEVVIISRNSERVAQTVADLQHAAANPNVMGLTADLASQKDVRRVAAEFMARYNQLDVLVNSVGATLLNYQCSPDGLEMTWALNYQGHFLLSYLLTGVLKQAAALHGEARIVEVTSSMYRFSPANFDRLQQAQGFRGVMAYAQSKRAMLTFTYEMSRRLQGSGVTINAVTPGAVKTNVAQGNNWWATLSMRVLDWFSQPADKGVQPIVRLASAPELRGVTGTYFVKTKAQPEDHTCSNPEITRQLWRLSEQMAGLSKAA